MSPLSLFSPTDHLMFRKLNSNLEMNLITMDHDYLFGVLPLLLPLSSFPSLSSLILLSHHNNVFSVLHLLPYCTAVLQTPNPSWSLL
jgi:hypothetical protein